MPFQFKPMPSLFPEMKIWGCVAKEFTFVISQDEDGFTASAKVQGSPQRIDLGGHGAHETFDSAQQACVDLAYRRMQ